ncbi:hypothetical protein ACFPVY_10740 [Flavobacterium qiangtangense]|uniref:Uncharacterized protein n=1 Tax=Flavobacterium qiangtangense TaxID=1442595 RepID=A0ABW1PNC4_9FLAO
MKTVSSLLFILLILSCRDKKNDIIQNRNVSIIDYQADSVYYKIDVINDGEKELFLVTNNYAVGDSIIGGISNYNNHKKGYNLINENPDLKKLSVYILSRIFYIEDNQSTQIAKISNRDDEFNYLILKQGYFMEPAIIDGKRISGGYLRIQEISDYQLGGKYLNLVYYKNKWIVFTKEIDNPTKGLPAYCQGYCVDTLFIDNDLNKGSFNEFFYSSGYCKCFETKN